AAPLAFLIAGATGKREAKEAFLKAQALCEGLVKDPGLAEYKSLAAITLNNLAAMEYWGGNLDEARALVDRMILLDQAALELSLRNTEFLARLANHQRFLANILDRQKQPVQAARM